MTVDEAIRDLLDISTDIRRLVVLDADGTVLGAGPGPAAAEAGAALDDLWQAARAGAPGDVGVEHVVVDLDDTVVAAVEAGGRRVVALTVPGPPLGLVLFDLRTCLADAFPDEAAAPSGEVSSHRPRASAEEAP